MSIKEALEETIPCVIGMMRPLYEAVDPMIMGEHRRSLAIGEEYANRLLALTKNPHRDQIIQKLVWKYRSHDFAIDIDEARALDLPVVELNKEQEDAFVDALLELVDHEISFCGFISRGERRPLRRVKPSAPAKPTTEPKAVAVA